jgi:hypothetical protein
MPLLTGSIQIPAPSIPESKDFWESPLHVSSKRYPDYDVLVHGVDYGGWDYESGWDKTTSSYDLPTMTSLLFYEMSWPSVATGPERSRQLVGSQQFRCNIAAASTIGSDVGFWLMDEAGPRITSFAELNSGISKGSEFIPYVHPSMSGVPGDNCEICVTGSSIRIFDITGSSIGNESNNWGGTGEYLNIINAQPGDRFTIYNTAPGTSSYFSQSTQAAGYPVQGGEYSSSYFLYSEGVLAKRYFNFDIYETSDNRIDTIDSTGLTLRQKYLENAYPNSYSIAWNTSSGDNNLSGIKEFLTESYHGTLIGKAYSSIEKWPLIPGDARSQILLKIPKLDEMLNMGESYYTPDSDYSSSNWSTNARGYSELAKYNFSTAGNTKAQFSNTAAGDDLKMIYIKQVL